MRMMESVERVINLDQDRQALETAGARRGMGWS